MTFEKVRTNFITSVPWSLGIASNITNKPKKVKLPGNKSIVLFRTKDNTIKAIDDVCPHRGASFSQGKVKGDCIECPYHGWTYDGNGHLHFIPSNLNKSKPLNADVESYIIKEYNNFVWILPDCEIEIPYCKELSTNKYNRVTGESVVKGNWIDWVANGLDISHINYVHDFADENNGEITDFKTYHLANSIKCKAYVRPKAVSVMTEPMQVRQCPIRAEFFYPNTSIVKIKLKDPYEFITYTTITPQTEDTSLMTWCFAYNINLLDPIAMKILKTKFHNEMLKTISEDEAIIKNLGPFDFDVNVPCDMYQIQGLKKIKELLEQEGEKSLIGV
tara:strand:+ start:2582 stop:3577 length:996 start_codon:yes stop_codon:yes gene_type:complete